MKLEIPNSFPNDMTTTEIQQMISECANRATSVSKTTSNTSLGANYYISMVALGQSEINKRIQSGHLDLIKKQHKQNKISSVINWILSGLTVFLAILTISLGNKSLGFAESDEKSDEIWQNQQINLLQKQNKELNHLNENLLKLIISDSIK